MHKILVVDDDKISHAFIKRALLNRYSLVHAYSGDEALKQLLVVKPDLVLLDVEMPGLNGYAVCELIKANPLTAEIPIIFLSARDDLRDQMQGFEAGADDYIVKPFQAEALVAKLKVIVNYQAKHTELILQVEDARKTAFIALSGSGDLGQAMQFIENSYTVSNYEQLANTFFRVTNLMGLNCSLLIRASGEDRYFSSSYNAVSPLEIGLINTLKMGDRFFDFGNRTQINYPKIAVLIKNMPLGDMERYGRIKDILPAMLSTADTKVKQLNALHAMTTQLQESEVCFEMITKTLEDINVLSQQQQKAGIKIMRNMLMELDSKLPSMALDEDQEQYILNRIDGAIDDAYTTISQTTKTNNAFESVIANLRALITHQQTLHDQMHTIDEVQDECVLAGYEMDVELF